MSGETGETIDRKDGGRGGVKMVRSFYWFRWGVEGRLHMSVSTPWL